MKPTDDGPGDPIIIKCHHVPPPCLSPRGRPTPRTCARKHHQHSGICDDCLADFRKVLADVPPMLLDLDAAIAGDVNFVERGQFAGFEADPDLVGGRNPAVLAQQRLVTAIVGDGTNAHPGFSDWAGPQHPMWMADTLLSALPLVQDEPRLPQLAQDISQAMSRAHHVIDRPKDLQFYGPCPNCNKELWQERVRDDEDAMIICHNRKPREDGKGVERCGYKEHLDVHQKRILDKAEDLLMTVTELVGALPMAGEPVSRHQINGWIRRKRLLERQTHKLKWNPETEEVEQIPEVRYRLGDARVLAEEAAERAKRKGER